jgi:hypothetical protein
MICQRKRFRNAHTSRDRFASADGWCHEFRLPVDRPCDNSFEPRAIHLFCGSRTLLVDRVIWPVGIDAASTPRSSGKGKSATVIVDLLYTPPKDGRFSAPL